MDQLTDNQRAVVSFIHRNPRVTLHAIRGYMWTQLNALPVSVEGDLERLIAMGIVRQHGGVIRTYSIYERR